MPIVTLATLDDVASSSSNTLIQANNYTNLTIPQQIQDVLIPLLPAKPSEVSNIGWDFLNKFKDANGNDQQEWETCPTIDYVDQSANISLDICKTLVASGKASSVLDSTKYTDEQLAPVKEIVNSLQVERGLTTFDVIMLLDTLSSKGGLEWQQ